MFQSALPSYPCALVLGWTVIALAPASSIILATSLALMLFSSQPLLILTVTGQGTASTTASTISFIFSGFFKSAAPACYLTATFGTGQPILISMISGFINSYTFLAATTKLVLSLPNICCAIGLSSSVI